MSLKEIIASNVPITETTYYTPFDSIIYKVLDIVPEDKRKIKLLVQYGSSIYSNRSRDIDVLAVTEGNFMVSLRLYHEGKEYDIKIAGEEYIYKHPEKFGLFLFPHKVLYGNENYERIVIKLYKELSKLVLNEGNKRKIKIKDLHKILWELERGVSGYLKYKIRKYSFPLPEEVGEIEIPFDSFKPYILTKIQFVIRKITQYLEYRKNCIAKKSKKRDFRRIYGAYKRVRYLLTNFFNKLLFIVGLDISKEVYALRKQCR